MSKCCLLEVSVTENRFGALPMEKSAVVGRHYRVKGEKLERLAGLETVSRMILLTQYELPQFLARQRKLGQIGQLDH